MSHEMLEILAEWRSRNRKQMRVAFFVAALLALLLWQTVWLRLRPPLAILLLGQFGTGMALLMRNRSLIRSADPTFAEELTFTVRLASFEYGCQMIGFAWLGYEFWAATNSLLVAILIGVVYPVSAYWGLARPRLARVRKLQPPINADGRR